VAITEVGKPQVAAWVIVALIACFALGMIIVVPLLPFTSPPGHHGIINPRFGSVPLRRSSTELEEGDNREDSDGWQQR
jgi:hypothetical protein